MLSLGQRRTATPKPDCALLCPCDTGLRLSSALLCPCATKLRHALCYPAQLRCTMPSAAPRYARAPLRQTPRCDAPALLNRAAPVPSHAPLDCACAGLCTAWPSCCFAPRLAPQSFAMPLLYHAGRYGAFAAPGQASRHYSRAARRNAMPSRRCAKPCATAPQRRFRLLDAGSVAMPSGGLRAWEGKAAGALQRVTTLLLCFAVRGRLRRSFGLLGFAAQLLTG